MGKEEFKAMIILIDKLIGIRERHPNDGPEMEALAEERRGIIIEAAREIIDEPWKKEEIIQ
jgi:hypothetical protein